MALFGGGTPVANADTNRLREKIEERFAEHPVMKVANLEYAMNRYFRNKVDRSNLPTEAFISWLIANYHTDGNEVAAEASLLPTAITSPVSRGTASHSVASSVSASQSRSPMRQPVATTFESLSLSEKLGRAQSDSVATFSQITEPEPEPMPPAPEPLQPEPEPEPELTPARLPPWMNAQTSLPVASTDQHIAAGHTSRSASQRMSPSPQPQPLSPAQASVPSGSPAKSGSIMDEMRSFLHTSQAKREKQAQFMALLPTLSGSVPKAGVVPMAASPVVPMAASPVVPMAASPAQASSPAGRDAPGKAPHLSSPMNVAYAPVVAQQSPVAPSAYAGAAMESPQAPQRQVPRSPSAYVDVAMGAACGTSPRAMAPAPQIPQIPQIPQMPQMPLPAVVPVLAPVLPQIPVPVKKPMSAAAAAAARAMSMLSPTPDRDNSLSPAPSPVSMPSEYAHGQRSLPSSPQVQAQQQPVGALDGVEAWSTNEVCSWVLNSGWGIWLKHFREAEIDGYELLRLTPGDLRIELGINNLNVRKGMLNQIAALQGYESHAAKWSATADTPEEMQLLCEAERKCLAELERLEQVVLQATVQNEAEFA